MFNKQTINAVFKKNPEKSVLTKIPKNLFKGPKMDLIV